MTLYLACDPEDYAPETGVCSDPYYAQPPTMLPELSAEDGLAVAAAIVSVWTIGLIARVLIRLAQRATP